MTRKERTAKIQELREKARDLKGQFDLYDYACADLRRSWLKEADRLRKQADELGAERKKKSTGNAQTS